MFCFVEHDDVADAYLHLLLCLVPVGDHATTPYLVDDWRFAWEDGQRKPPAFVKLQDQIEVGRRARPFVKGWLDRFEELLVVVLVRLVVPDVEHFEVLEEVRRNHYGHLDWRLGLPVTCYVVLVPVVHAVFDLTYPIDVAEYFEATRRLPIREPLDLLLAVVGQEIHHGLVDFGEGGNCPLEGRDVDEAIQIVDAKAYDYPVSRCNLDLVLAVAWHSVGEVDPGASWPRS